jgi:hypothetical protein
MNLREQFEKEIGKRLKEYHYGTYHFSDEYVKYLEEKLAGSGAQGDYELLKTEWKKLRRFILNGVEYGFIILPPKNDLAVDIYAELCKSAEPPKDPKPGEDIILQEMKKPLARPKPPLKPDSCAECGGKGWYADHDRSDPHENGCSGSCPVQVQCEKCNGTGKGKER